MPTRLSLLVLLLLTAASSVSDARAQAGPHAPSPQPLYREIATMDSIMFHAFNMGDLETLGTLFTEDLEFYHDKSGLTSYEDNMAAFANLFSRNDGLTRTLVPGSLEVFPVNDYGAIEVGRHTFCHSEGGEEDCGTFPFVQIWRKDGDAWKVSRVVSYGH